MQNWVSCNPPLSCAGITHIFKFWSSAFMPDLLIGLSIGPILCRFMFSRHPFKKCRCYTLHVSSGTSIPKSGADYAYIGEAFGSLPSFLYLWDAIFIFVPTTNAIMGLTVANYLAKPLFPDCDPPDAALRLIAAVRTTSPKIPIVFKNIHP